MRDSFGTRTRLQIGDQSLTTYSLPALARRLDAADALTCLPYSMKILLENLLRHEDGGQTVGKEHIESVAT